MILSQSQTSHRNIPITTQGCLWLDITSDQHESCQSGAVCKTNLFGHTTSLFTLMKSRGLSVLTLFLTSSVADTQVSYDFNYTSI